ncbi:hypothetical protein K493DRAFT_304530 [Basidiobolus meristosporus CBS 931.73]|uniref:SNF2 N-terminal domain-containing protein n=1 Tax=Basidiobolus meristosporus CBS 931.73 TaxID=1314790 RepID=A0A1Y1XYN1_9FUNG|nr:hypothetical protein K493DRAFT_304530 [Basidiobolus meristosporus CBS 931.73]|eukprot:ORX90851.1 hypothetical protein K493DRAFT_304530 [Basidiobolus meristosporus CBS 931.73]
MALEASSYKEHRKSFGVYLATVAGVTKRSYCLMTITPSMKNLLLYGGYSIEHFEDSKISLPYDEHIAEETSGRGILYEPSSKVQMIHLADLHGDEDITVTVLLTPDNISTTEAAKGVILIGNSCASDHKNLYIYGGFELSHREYSGQHESAKKWGEKAIQSKSGETINRRLSKLEVITYKDGNGCSRVLETRPFLNNPANMPSARGWAVLTNAFDCLFLLGGYPTPLEPPYTQPNGSFLNKFYCLKLQTGDWERQYVHSAIQELGENFIAVVNEYGNQIQYINNANVTFTYDVDNQIWIYPPNPSQEEMSTKQLLGRILNELATISQRHKREGKGSAETQNFLRHSAHGLTVPLKHHQAFGVQWLMYTEAIHKGALLANSMGLGKTLQILSLILETPEQRPNLIVVTLGILLNWVMEIKTKTRISNEELHVFHGKF